LIDLLSAQREVIYFLVKKLQIEEQQRLKTEEQASKMMLHMEKTVKQLVNFLSRKLIDFENRKGRIIVQEEKSHFHCWI